MSKSKQAVDAPRQNIFALDPDEVTIITDKEHPLYDPRVELPLNEGMIQSFLDYGWLGGVCTMRKEGDLVVPDDGLQRTRNAQEAKRRGAKDLRILVYFKRGTDVAHFRTKLALNLHRVDDDPVTQAENAARLMEMVQDEDEVAKTFSITRQHLKAVWWKLMELSAPVKDAVRSGKVGPTAAVKWHGLSAAEQKEALSKYLSLNKKTVHNAKKLGSGGRAEAHAPGKTLLRKLDAVIESGEGAYVVPESHKTLLKFVLGEISEEEAVEQIDWLEECLTAARKKRGKAASANGVDVSAEVRA